MSVAKLCEALVRSKEQGLKSKEQGAELDRLKSLDSAQDDMMRRAESLRTKAENEKFKVESERLKLEVLTTTANGKIELDVEVGQSIAVDGVHVKYFKRWTKDHSHFSPGLLWGLYRMLRQAQHDNLIIHIHAWWNLVSVLSCLVAKWYNVPVVLSPRGMLTGYTQNSRNSFPKRFLHLLIGKRLLSYSHIHATSEQEKLEVLKIVSPKSITVIPNLVSVGQRAESGEQGTKNKEQGTKSEELCEGESLETKAVSDVGSSTFRLLFLSRIEQKKGLELLFEALSTISLNYQLTIAGSGHEKYVESLKAKVESLKLSGQIDWLGQVNNEEKFSLLARHDLLVLPSYNENFANVVIESLSVGTPVLVSENVGLAAYVKSNDFGWVCTLNSFDIKEKIATAYQNKLKRDFIRQEAPNIILNDFNDEVLAERYMELYRNVLRLRSGGQP